MIRQSAQSADLTDGHDHPTGGKASLDEATCSILERRRFTAKEHALDSMGEPRRRKVLLVWARSRVSSTMCAARLIFGQVGSYKKNLTKEKPKGITAYQRT